jgi:hypothetical protein
MGGGSEHSYALTLIGKLFMWGNPLYCLKKQENNEVKKSQSKESGKESGKKEGEKEET